MQQPGLPTGQRVQNPEHGPGPRRHNLCKQRKGDPRQGAGIPAFGTHHLMQASAGKTTGGKQRVQPFKTEGQPDRFRPLLYGGKSRGRTKLPVEGEASLKGRNAATQLGKIWPAFSPVFWRSF